MWQVTRDRWHMTGDSWYMTRDMWHMTHVNILSKFQLSRSNGLGFMKLWISGGKGWLTQIINDEAVCRTAPATPGLLIISPQKIDPNHSSYKFSQLGKLCIYIYVFIPFTLLYCADVQGSPVQCSSTQAVHCTNFRSSPLICTKPLKAAYYLLQHKFLTFV